MDQAEIASQSDLHGRECFPLWRDGEIVGKVVHLEGDVETAGAKLGAPDTLLPLLSDFLRWSPIPPRNAKKLAHVSARLCRLLRDEVVEQMARGNQGLTDLAKDSRKLLFPEANDAQFADGYAAFGLLVARARKFHCRTASNMPLRNCERPIH